MFTMSLASKDEAAGSSSHTATTVALLQKRVDDLSGQLSAVQHMVEDGLTEKKYVVEASKDRILKEIHVLLSQSKQDMQVSVQACRVSLQQELRDFVQQQEQQQLKEFRDEIDSLREQTRLTDASLMDKAPAPNDNPDKLKDVMATIERIVQEQEYLRKLQESTNVEAMRAEIQSILADMGVPSSSEKYGNMEYASKEPNVDKHDALAKEGEQHDDLVKEHRHDNIVNAQLEEPGESFKEDDNLKDPMNTQEVVDKIHMMEEGVMPEELPYQEVPCEDVYEVRESVWDIGLFSGHDMNIVDGMLVILACLVNIALQLGFVYALISGSIGEPTITAETLVDLGVWRLVVGHDAWYLDDWSQTSLVARICDASPLTVVAVDRKLELYDYRAYQMRKTGNLLSVIALTAWLLNIGGELMIQLNFLECLIDRPSAKATSYGREQGLLTVETLSYSRKIWLTIFVVIPRFIVAILLCYVGFLYLIYQKAIGEIILNALALGFVLDLDEFLYTVLVPPAARLSASCKPIPLRGCGGQRGRSRVIALAFIVATTIGIAWFTQLTKEIQLLDDAKSIMCDGDRDFVYARDPSTSTIATAPTRAVTKIRRRSYADVAVFQRAGLQSLQLKTFDDLNEWNVDGQVFSTQTVDKVNSLLSLQHRESIDQLPCLDFSHTNMSMLWSLRYLLDNFSVQGCPDLAAQGLCGNGIVQVFCPDSCHCVFMNTNGQSYTSGEGLGQPADNCTSQCMLPVKRQLPLLKDRLTNSVEEDCVDRLGHDPWNTGDEIRWNRTLRQLLAHFDSILGLFKKGSGFDSSLASDFLFDTNGTYQLVDGNASLILWAEQTMAKGVQSCSFLDLVYAFFGEDLCSRTDSMGLQALCPATCGLCSKDLPDMVEFDDNVEKTTIRAQVSSAQISGAGRRLSENKTPLCAVGTTNVQMPSGGSGKCYCGEDLAGYCHPDPWDEGLDNSACTKFGDEEVGGPCAYYCLCEKALQSLSESDIECCRPGDTMGLRNGVIVDGFTHMMQYRFGRQGSHKVGLNMASHQILMSDSKYAIRDRLTTYTVLEPGRYLPNGVNLWTRNRHVLKSSIDELFWLQQQVGIQVIRAANYILEVGIPVDVIAEQIIALLPAPPSQHSVYYDQGYAILRLEYLPENGTETCMTNAHLIEMMFSGGKDSKGRKMIAKFDKPFPDNLPSCIIY